MSSTTSLCRVAGARRLATHRTASRLAALRASHWRTYATPSQEPDPQLGDYPQLPWVSRQTLPAKGWDDQLMRRNFGDTLHEQEEVLSMWGPDVPPIAPQRALLQFTVAVLGFVSFGFLVKNVLAQEPPVIRREYPFDGLVTELGGHEEIKARAESLEED